jgi:hypothetical protein
MRQYENIQRMRRLTAIEQREYDALKVEQQRMISQLAEAQRRDEQTRAARRAAAEREYLTSFPNIATNPLARQEFALHSYRQALLDRLRALAQADGRSDLFARIDALVAKENGRHQAWLMAHRGGR